ncbi:MAG: hypothetical protein NDJ90_03855 [Oligoflexia bacterium]|nr:hypothetical protein [Oligoflexia bacterium]
MATYRRRIYLVDKKFQFRLSLYVSAWVVALSFVYPLVVYNVFEFFIQFALATPMGPEIELLRQTRKEVLWLLIGSGVTFVLLTFFSSLFLAHRIAGPIYKFRMYLNKAKAGNYNEPLSFRRWDHFQYLATDYNELIAGLRGKMDQATAGIEKALVSASPENRQELEKALAALRH